LEITLYQKAASLQYEIKIGVELTCRAKICLIVSGSEWGCASTLEMTGILGVRISVAANADSNLETAGCMKLVWKAPATARRTWKHNS